MSWSFVGTTNYAGGGAWGTQAKVTRTTTQGNLLIAFAESSVASDDGGLSFSGGGTWTVIDHISDTTNNNALVWAWAVASTTGSVTVTGNGGTANCEGMFVEEWSSSNGAISASALDVHNFNNHTASPGSNANDGDTGGSITPTQNGDLIISLASDTQINSNGSSAWTAGGSPNAFTKRSTTDLFNDAVSTPTSSESFVQSTAAAINPTWTRGNQDEYAGFSAAFKEPAASTTPIPNLVVPPYFPT